ncbi:MAG: S-methyl-5'-thioadenosine phosphorylase [Candidatus Hodarchaeota archaeon]
MLVKPPEKVTIGMIGGTGVYDPAVFTDIKEYKIYTPFGAPSDKIMIGTLQNRRIAFIPRHGRDHIYPPHLVNYRANIWALKSLGVRRLLTVSAVGSLQDEIRPGDLFFPDQCFDWTRSRVRTFFETGTVAHVSVAEPFCPELTGFIAEKAKGLKLPYHHKGTVITIEGPQFSTKAESRFYRAQGFHIIGMTLHPEVYLARETELCFANISMITDYDVYAEKPVSHEEVQKTMSENLDKVKKLLIAVIPTMSEKQDKCSCGSALQGAV